jgi:lysophospholipase L1-like esterase
VIRDPRLVVRASALSLLALIACGGEPAEPAAPRTRVLLVGDSITAGLVSEPTGPSYAEILTDRLGDRFEIVNLGCGGSSSLDWTRSRGVETCAGRPTKPSLYDARVVPAMPAEIACVMLGTNDARGVHEKMWITPDEYEAAIREIATNLLDDGAGTVLLLGPPLALQRVQAMLRIFGYGKALASICEEMPRVRCGPDVSHLLTQDDYESGNVHPNGSGHAKIAEALAEALLAQGAPTDGG